MNNKKTLIKIIHSILIIVTTIMCVISLINASPANDGVNENLTSFINFSYIVALVASIFYLLSGYKKNSASYYKITIGLLMLAQALYIVNMFYSNMMIAEILLHVISLILIVVLASVKDFGKKNSNIVVILLALCRIVLLIISYNHLSSLGNLSITNLCTEISNLLFVGTIGLMVDAKYEDKRERGRQ